MLTRLIERTSRASRVLVPAAAAVLAPWLAPLALADEPVEMARLAPARSFFVLSVPNFTKMKEGFDRSSLGALWKEPGVASFVERVTKEQVESLGEFLKEFNAEAEDLRAPTGAVGLALFMPDGPRKDEDGNEEEPVPDVLVVAEMGENADAWYDLVETILERAEKEKEITTLRDKHGEATITTIKAVVSDEDEEEEEGEEADEDSVLGGFLTGPMSDWATLYLARAGTTLSVSSDLKALESALDTMEGKPGEFLADSPTYKDAMGQLAGGEHAYLVFIVDPLLKMMRESMEEDMPTEAVAALVEGLGVANVKAVSLGMVLDTPEADVLSTMGILVPEKEGLVGLLTGEAGPFDPPAFVSPDAASVSRLSVNFAGLLGVVREALGKLPEEERAQPLAAIDQAQGIAQPALEALGPSVYIVSSYKRPLAADSEMMLVAIDVKDQLAITNTISFLVGQAQGMVEPRDFDGNTIYTMQFPLEMSLGVGFGRLFIGQTAAVENAMRLAGRADGPRLTEEPVFKDAVRALGNDAVFYTYTDLDQSIRFMYWTAENEEKIYEKVLDDAGLDADEKAEFMKEFRENLAEWPKHLPPLETVLRHLGASVQEIKATPDGFRGRALMLRPSRD